MFKEWHLMCIRYGFHGPSHQYVVTKTAKLLNKPLSDLAIVSCHLGAGCSVTASLGGVSQDTSMGFSPLSGLMMGGRCGDIDASIVPHMATQLGLETTDILSMMNSSSGFMGIAGTPDSRYGSSCCTLYKSFFPGILRTGS